MSKYLILGLVAALVVVGLLLEIKDGELDTANAQIEAQAKDIARQAQDILGYQAVIKNLEENLAGIRRAYEQQRRIAAEAGELRRQLAELRNNPGPCDTIRSRHAEIATDATDLFNAGHIVRGKVVHPDAAPGGDPETVPAPAGAAGADEPKSEIIVPILIENYVALVEYVLKFEESQKECAK